MLSMIFALAIIAVTTLVVTIFALCFVGWLLGNSQPLCDVEESADTFLDEEAPAFPRHLVIG